jgi:hypothetical protein
LPNGVEDDIQRLGHSESGGQYDVLRCAGNCRFGQTHQYGRWAFAEFTDVYQMETDFEAKINKMIDSVAAQLGATEK